MCLKEEEEKLNLKKKIKKEEKLNLEKEEKLNLERNLKKLNLVN